MSIILYIITQILCHDINTNYFKMEIQATLNLQGRPFGIKVCIYDFYLYFISMNVFTLYVLL